MYSIVLLAAMAPGSDVTPAPVAVAAPVAAYGCCGGVVAYGCCGGSCYGSCHGGGFGRKHGCHGGMFGHKSSCHGCCGGYGCSGWSCFGSGYGCCGGYAGYWSSGCWGSCYGSGWGCGGAVYPSYTYPAYGPVYGPSTVIPLAPGGGTAPPPMTGGTTPVKPEDKDTKKGGTSGMGANIKFRVPAGAMLYVDGRATGGEGAERAFYTPPLEAGQKYFYEVKAELVVAGKTVVEEKRVIVEAGANLVESFPVLTAAAEKAATVASK